MKLLCKVKGEHDWFPNNGRSEFIPLSEVCLRCGHQRTLLPFGWCLGNHPLAEHYDKDGHVKPFDCRAGGPQ